MSARCDAPGTAICAWPSVCIVIVNWNGLPDTLDCLRSVQELGYPSLDVVVVDNASRDGSAQVLCERFPALSLVQNPSNLGFAEGSNAGIEIGLRQGTDYVLLLNNDATIDPQALKALIRVGESDVGIGILTPKIVYHHNPRLIWAAGMEVVCDSAHDCWLASRAVRRRKGWFTTLLSSCRGHNETDKGQFDTPEEIQAASGCALLIKAEVIRRIGLLDGAYFLLFEDTDWCMRARRTGYRIMYVPEALVWHKASRSLQGSRSPAALYYSTRNTLLFARRYGKRSVKLYFGLVALAILVASCARWLLRRDQVARFRARAVADAWLGRWGKRL